MSNPFSLSCQTLPPFRGLDESAVIERVVPGKLVYVTTTPDPSHGKTYTFVFKLDQVVIRKRDGSCRPYRGEPLFEWGIHRGAKVVVWGINDKTVKPALVIDADRPREFNARRSLKVIGGYVASFLNKAIDLSLMGFRIVSYETWLIL